jgi:predicted unusual protein kinase regulating ubiquinone biosynthesis (AarF/ABC1/UbiB family)
LSDELPAPGDATDASRGAQDGIGQGRLRRAAPILGLTARTAGEALVVGVRSRLTGADTTDFHIRTAERYVELLGRSKGALMKAGQMLSLTPIGPGVPADLQAIYQTALARLRSDVPPMAPELAHAVLERELGRTAASVFAELDRQPLAAASIGQVHAARLHDGREVAVKIQYPGVADAIAADLKNAELLATFLSVVAGGMSARKLSFDIRGAAREIGSRIAEELDYRREAASQADFARHYRGHPFIRVPEVIDELSSARVLTQELVRGLPWSDAVTAEQELRDSWAEAIHRFVYGAYNRFCMFNADPHPGNYLFHEDGSVSCLDFGCVKRLRREQVQMMDAVVAACMRHDVLGTWRASVEAGFWRASDPVTCEEAFSYWYDDWAMMSADQRFVVTPEYVASWFARKISPNGPSANACAYVTVPPEYTMIGRVELGVASIVAQLRAGNVWGAMAAERFWNAEPQTEMGKLERAFFEERQVPGLHTQA